VHIFDRHGERVDEISLSGTGRVISLAWDHEGESLAVLQEGNAIIPIWDQGSKAVLSVDTNLKDPTFMAWSRVGPQLAIGTAKGNLLLYNKRTRKKIPVLGKHPRKITCGAWSRSNQLALGSEDKTLTLSNDVGDTLAQTELKLAALQMNFAVQKRGGSSSSAANSTTAANSGAAEEQPDNCISIVMGGKSLLLYSLTDPDNPIELAFLPKYGDVVCHRWFGDGFVLLGFSEGYLVIVSTHAKEMGEEQFSGKFHAGALTELACSDVLRRAATAGEGGVKILDLATYKELHSEAVSIDSAVDGRVCGLAWSPDGQILTVATKAGVVFNFLARMPTVHAAHGAHVAYLSSLREITIADCSPQALAAERPRPPTIIPVALEPSFVALGDAHVAVGMNSTALFYRRAGGGEVGGQQEYPGAVEELCLNSRYAAVLFGSQIVLHLIERAVSDDASEQLISRRTFPAREDSSGAQGHATAVALTEALLIYGTRSGTVEFFYLPEGGCALSGATLRHAHPVRRIAPNHLGTRVLLCDSAGEGLFYSPATGETTPAGGFPGGTVTRIMWDCVDRNVVAVCDGASLHLWVFTPLSLKGAAAFKLGAADVDDEGALAVAPRAWALPGQHSPVLMANGQVTCHLNLLLLTTASLKPSAVSVVAMMLRLSHKHFVLHTIDQHYILQQHIRIHLLACCRCCSHNC
jgi:WD repeat-containing protein 19